MKEHAKKALKHDFKVAGKTVPTLAIVALFLVGTGSAALLTSFGTVSGEADVSSPVQINGQNGEDIDTNSLSVSSSVGGGAIASKVYNLTNVANETVPVTFDANTSIVGDSFVENPEGFNTSFVVYSKKTDRSTPETFGVDVDVVTDQAEVENGNYDVRLSSEGQTKDYAVLWYSIDEEVTSSNADSLQIDALAHSDHTAGQPEDEVYVLDSQGDLYFTTSSDISTVVSEKTQESVEIGDIDVAAVGFGFGDADRSDGTTVNITVGDVSFDGTSLSEKGEDISSFPLTPTGDVTANAAGTVIDVHSTYQFQTVTDFSYGFYTKSGNQLKVEASIK